MSEVEAINLSCPVSIDNDLEITLAHGSGGSRMHNLLNKVILPSITNVISNHDSATLNFADVKLAFTTDSFVVNPLFFPGGDIGSLSVYGTANDLAMSGAKPRYMSLAFILEEGFKLENLKRILQSIKNAAESVGVQVVTGDTKVVEHGRGHGLYINTAGIGVITHNFEINPQQVQQQDVVIVSGDIGRHGIAVMAQREGLQFDTSIISDSASVSKIVECLLRENVTIHCLRDITRGGLATTLNAWDVSYYSEMYKQIHYQVSQEKLRVYFPEQQVLTGLFKLVQNLFGLQIEEITDFQKWHDTVRLFAVKDQNGNLRGKFYIDLYARDFKRGGAWMADLLSRIRYHDDKLQTPVAFLEANFTPPVANKPALLSHDDVMTLFHEFGHTLHHILTQVDYFSAAGINGVAWDAVELPSQFMENWCWEWDVIRNISSHYQTGKHLPKAEFDKLLATKNFQSAMQIVRQLELSLFDFRLHLNQPADRNKTPQQLLTEINKQVSVIPVPAYNRFQNSFLHIFNGGYAAGYFSYKWAEVLSSDAFELFKETGTFNSKTGQKFLTTILEQGGSREAMELFIEFRGREPTIDALLKHNGISK